MNLINIVVSDVDSANVTATLTLSNVAAGSLSTGTSGAVTSTYMRGVWTASGAIANVNTLLAGVSFTPALNFNSNFTIATSVSDGVAPAITGVKAMTGTPVNDAPVNTVPGAQVVTEDTALAIGGLSVNDVDGNLSTVQLAVANGTMTVSLAGGATISSGANGTTTLTLAGTQAQINAALGTLAYQGMLNYTGPDTLTLTSADTGSATDLDTVTITVTAVNDAPILISDGGGAMAAVTLAENQTAVTTVTSTDVDGGAPTYSIIGGADAVLFTLNPTTGALTFNAGPNFEAPVDAGTDNVYNVTVQVADGNGGTDTQVFSITVTDVNEALPPTIAPPPVPPSLVPQSPGPPSGGFPPAGSPPLPSIVVGPPPSPLPNPEPSVVPIELGNMPSDTAPLPQDTSGLPTQGKGNTQAPFAPLTQELRGYVEEKVPPLTHQTDEEVRKVLDKQTLAETRVQLNADFQKMLRTLEENLRREADTAESNRQLIVRITNIGGITLTAGFITWLLQSGSLLASLTATLPAWRHFDPLPVTLVGDRERRKRKAETAAAAEHENTQFRGLGNLLDKNGERSDGGGTAT